MIELSVVIPTYNRRAILQRCLSALFAQRHPGGAWEIVVVDDGSSDGTADLVAGLRAPCDLRIVRQANSGAGVARNHGARVARGRVLLFLDDDIVADPGLVAAHLRAHREQRGIIGLGRLTLHVDGRPDPFARYYRTYWREHYARLARDPEAVAYRDCFGGNLSVERDAFFRVGGFATDLPRNHDIELGYRLAGDGLCFLYLPGAVGSQIHLKNARTFVHEHERNGELGPTLSQRHPDTLPALILGAYDAAPLIERVVRGALLALGAPIWPAWLLDPGLSRVVGRSWYRFLMRYAYWRGARRAVRDRGTWGQLTRGPVILAYHAVGTDDEPASRFVVPRRTFARQMRWLRARGYTMLSLGDYLAMRREHRLSPQRSVIVTFDDAYVDTAAVAHPILVRLGIPATVFVVTGKVGGTNDWSAEPALVDRPLLGWDAIRGLAARGMTIGAHGRTHADLTDLAPDRLPGEIGGSLADLERELGSPPIAFAYPYGRSDRAVRAAVLEAGFAVGLTTEPRPSGPSESDLALPRMEVYGTAPFLQFILGIRIGDTSWLPRRLGKALSGRSRDLDA